MNEPRVERDARVLCLLTIFLPGQPPATPAPLGAAEWRRIGTQLRQAGLSRPGELLEVGAGFWPATGLDVAEIQRLRGLLERADRLDPELERLAGVGIRTVTTAEPAYPARLRARLRGQAPAVLFGAGDWALAGRPALAVAGSRGVDAASAAFTRALAGRCARDGLTVVTGGAKGVDQIAMEAALAGGGCAVGVAAGDLERSVRQPPARGWVEDGRLLLLSPYHPKMGFTAGNAMARNKLIYALSDYGLVVASTYGQGGTWAGAQEVLRRGWVPLFVRDDPQAPDGNRELLRPAARPFPPLDALGDMPLGVWLAEQVVPKAWPPPASGTGACAGGQDLFPLFWPLLARFLETPRSEAEISAGFGPAPEQSRAWVGRALSEGRMVREGPAGLICCTERARI